MTRSLLVVACLLVPLPVAAQVTAGVPFPVYADVDPEFAIFYRVLANDIPAGQDVAASSVVNGRVQLLATLPTAGTYRIMVAVYDGIGREVLSVPPDLVVTAAPLGGAGDCTAGWTLDSDGHTRRNGVLTGAGYGTAYACVGPRLFVLGGDGKWWEWLQDVYWGNPVAILPGVSPLPGLLAPGALRLQ